MASETKELARLTRTATGWTVSGSRCCKLTKPVRCRWTCSREQDRISAQLDAINNRIAATMTREPLRPAQRGRLLSGCWRMSRTFTGAVMTRTAGCATRRSSPPSRSWDREPQVAHQHPFDALCDPGVQGNTR